MARWHALWLKLDLTPAIEREVNIERLVTVARHQPVAALAHSINSAILIAVVWPHLNHWLLLSVAAIFQGAALSQFYEWWRHRKHRRPSRVADSTINRIVVWALFLGILWGAFSTTLLATSQLADVYLLVIMVLAGMAAGGTIMLHGIPAALFAFLMFSFVPPWILIAARDGMIPAAVMTFAAVYFVFLAVSARFGYHNFVESVRLRMQNADLAYKADAANRAKSRFLANMSHESSPICPKFL